MFSTQCEMEKERERDVRSLFGHCACTIAPLAYGTDKRRAKLLRDKDS